MFRSQKETMTISVTLEVKQRLRDYELGTVCEVISHCNFLDVTYDHGLSSSLLEPSAGHVLPVGWGRGQIKPGPPCEHSQLCREWR